MINITHVINITPKMEYTSHLYKYIEYIFAKVVNLKLLIMKIAIPTNDMLNIENSIESINYFKLYTVEKTEIVSETFIKSEKGKRLLIAFLQTSEGDKELAYYQAHN